MDITINIAKDFSSTPGGRTPDEGPGDGETFRKKHLVPALQDKTHDKVFIDMAGCAGFPWSFLEEAFGGLVRKEHFSADELKKKLRFIENREYRIYVQIIKKFIADGSES